MDFDGLALRACLGLLRRQVVGARLRHLAQPTGLSLALAFRVAGHPLWLICSAEPAAACLFPTAEAPAESTPPSPFCTILRRHIGGMRLTGAAQDGWDRVVSLTLEGHDELGNRTAYTLIVEIMGKHSNIICVRQDGRILDAVKRIGSSKSRIRQVLPGRAYAPPPSQSKLAPDKVSGCDLAVILADRAAGAAGHAGPRGLIQAVAGIGTGRATSLWSAAMETAAAQGDTAPDWDALAQSLRDAAKSADAAEETGRADELCRRAAEEFRRQAALAADRRIAGAGSGPGAAGGEAAQERLAERIAAAARLEQKRHAAIAAQARAMEDAEIWLRRGNALLASLGLVRERLSTLSGTRSIPLIIDLPDHRAGDGRGSERLVQVELCPGEEPARVAQRCLERYARLRRQNDKLTALLAESSARLDHLAELKFQVEQGLTPQELAEVAAEAAAEGVRGAGPSARPERGRRRWTPATGTQSRSGERLEPSPPVSFRSPGGYEILVGRNNRQNEILMRRGAGDDIWLHAKGVPGAHVLLRRAGRSGDVPSQDLLFAAGIAAGQSQAAPSATAAVDYTELRMVRRGKGARPGFVTYTGERTIHVRPTSLHSLTQ